MKQGSQAHCVPHIASVPFFVQQVNTRMCGFPCIDKHIKIVDISENPPFSTSLHLSPPPTQSIPEMTLLCSQCVPPQFFIPFVYKQLICCLESMYDYIKHSFCVYWEDGRMNWFLYISSPVSLLPSPISVPFLVTVAEPTRRVMCLYL